MIDNSLGKYLEKSLRQEDVTNPRSLLFTPFFSIKFGNKRIDKITVKDIRLFINMPSFPMPSILNKTN